MQKVVPLIVALLLLTSVFVTAAGRSTGFTTTPPNEREAEQTNQPESVSERAQVIEQRRQQRQTIINERTKERIQERQAKCEVYTNRKDRIRCRLQQDVDDYTEDRDFSAVPEACRKVDEQNNPGKKRACIALYKRSAACYDLSGSEKDKCFRRAVGQVKKTMSRADTETKRNYLVLLLYDLQERIEWSYDNGRIDEATTTEIVDGIVELKDLLFNGAPRSEIKAASEQLKEKIKAARSGEDMMDDEGREDNE